MRRLGATRRLLAAGGALAATAALTAGAMPGPAFAATPVRTPVAQTVAAVAPVQHPATTVTAAGAVRTVVAAKPKPPAKPDAAAKPTAVRINGPDLDGDLQVRGEDQPQLFQIMLSEVSWLATATPQTAAPPAGQLGPKYTVTVLVKNAPQQVYDLYPLASGGPRAHRPAAQPTGKKAAGWFYGRLTMSESLRLSGVPLEARTDVVLTGGIGGGFGEQVEASELDAAAGINDFVNQMRRLMLLNGAVLVVILSGLGGIAYLIRRKV